MTSYSDDPFPPPVTSGCCCDAPVYTFTLDGAQRNMSGLELHIAEMRQLIQCISLLAHQLRGGQTTKAEGRRSGKAKWKDARKRSKVGAEKEVDEGKTNKRRRGEGRTRRHRRVKEEEKWRRKKEERKGKVNVEKQQMRSRGEVLVEMKPKT
eukprot:TRINITY_DN8334_c0_g2_i1.p2 TRINITY_DN8334_c0_g2~~TRINITY_DN8334_c0_g2_i1.p2  ORF type:complete len:152 (+),score=28.84 TRINITY_DN8334_c0_g2_i1:1-456(+)